MAYVMNMKLGTVIMYMKCMSYTGFVWLFCIQGEIIDVQTEILTLGLFQRLRYRTSSKFVQL